MHIARDAFTEVLDMILPSVLMVVIFVVTFVLVLLYKRASKSGHDNLP